MVAVLREHQHELLYPNGSSALVFGTMDTKFMTLTEPKIETGSARTNDVDRAREDGAAFGDDYSAAKTVNFEIGVFTDHLSTDPDQRHQLNLDALDRFWSTWEDPVFRTGTNTVATLRSCQGGVTYRCYGRPRNPTEISGQFTRRGYTPITAEFHLIDTRWYSDVDTVEVVPYPAAITNPGVASPLTDPMTTSPLGERPGAITVGGRTATWPVVTIYGFVTNPVVRIGSKVVWSLSGTVGWGDWVRIDTRPWQRSVRSKSGGSWAGRLSSTSTMLKHSSVAPGSYQVTYSGVDPAGTSRVEVRWADARTRP